MKVKCKYEKLVDVDLLVPHKSNNNKHSDRQIELLAKIIDYGGFRHPVIVSKRSNFIVAGHARVAAAKKLGYPQVPVDYQDFENEAAEFSFLIADNQIAKLAEFDHTMMIDEIKLLGIEDFELLGLDDFELPLEPDAAKEEIEDDVPENVETRCKPGDLWILGEHRLLCGDSSDSLLVDRLMNSEKACMVYTDPPYGINLDTDFSKMSDGGYAYKKVANDNVDFDPGFILGYFSECEDIFLWGAENYLGGLGNHGSWIVWDKSTDQADDCFFANPIELCWSKKRHKYAIYRKYWRMMAASEGGEKRMHPTQKPIAMAEMFIDKWGKDKTNIVDLFGGSGSTLIACEKTKRKCFMMELDPHYCSVILSRWEKYSGKEAKLNE